MELRLTYFGKVTDDIKIFRAKEMREMVIRNFAGKQIEITIQKKRKRRSLEQNQYYWAVVVPVVMRGLNDAGYRVDKDGTHEFLKSMFNKKEIVNQQTGEILPTIGSTTKMSTLDMMEFFEEIRQWSAEFLNVQIPEPGEQLNFEIL